jgi:hypothetical protein
MDDTKEDNEMAASVTKPIRPTVIKFDSDKEYNDFVEWAEGKHKANNAGIQRAQEVMKKHKASMPKK